MKKYFYLEHWLGPKLMYIDAYGNVEEDKIISISSRGVSEYDKCEHKPCIFDNKNDYLQALQLKCDCGVNIGYYNLGDANHLEVLKMVGNPKMKNTPLPIVKDNKALCPMCNKEVLIGEIVLTRPPWYRYYCTNCTYCKEDITYIIEADNKNSNKSIDL